METKVYAQALFNFEPQYADELSIKAGCILQILYEINEDWIYAKSLMVNDSSHIGILPKNFVRIVSIPDYLIDENPTEMFYLAIENFVYAECGDLELKKDDILKSQNWVDENWLFGYCIKDLGKTGIFPLTHVTRIYLESSSSTKAIRSSDESDTQNSFVPTSGMDKKNKYVLRQAISVYAFDSALTNGNGWDGNEYLKFDKGDYILVTGHLDDQNWLKGENLKGEKGIFPAEYIQYISNDETDSTPTILNRTQRRYTMSSIDYEPIKPTTEMSYLANDYATTEMQKTPTCAPISPKLKITEKFSSNIILENDQTNSSSSLYTTENLTLSETNDNLNIPDIPSLPNDSQSTGKFCIVDFDFQPEHENELGCTSGEYLRSIQVIDESINEWMIAENVYGKRGLIPISFITMLVKDYPEVTKLFEIKQHTPKLTSEQTKFKSPQYLENVALRKETTSAKDCQRSMSLNTNSFSPLNFRSPSTNRPVIPPKPKLTIAKSVEISKTSIRPALYDNKLLANIKTLETNIQKQLVQQQNSNAPLSTNQTTHRMPKIEYHHMQESFSDEDEFIPNEQLKEHSVKLKCLQDDLTNMKDRFIESATNRQVAIAQVKEIQGNKLLGDLEVFQTEQTVGSTKCLIKNEPIIDTKTDEKRRKKKELERKYSINELYETEKDYCQELSHVYDAFMNDNDAPEELDKQTLFEELKLVITVSNHLVSSLETELASNSEDQIRVGICLTESSDDMKIIYAKYLQSHSNVTQIIKNYELNPRTNDYINDRLEKLKTKCKVPTLQSLLIKPVQRIFKYPLFLKRIYDNTEPSHCDHSNLKEALDTFTNMLDFINEYKRRKDLVSKYLSTRPDEQNIGDMIKKINLKTLKKKTTRISVQFSNILGLYSHQIIDETYYRAEADFRIAEKSLQALSNNLDEYLVILKSQLDADSVYYHNLPILLDEGNKVLISLQNASGFRYKRYKEYAQDLVTKVSLPLENLITYLNGPNKLIDKRNDKLVDYEAALTEVKQKNAYGPGYVPKELEKDLEKFRKDYEALNSQLIEELPLLTQKLIRILIASITCYSTLTRDYYKKVKLDLMQRDIKKDFEISSVSEGSVSELNSYFNNNLEETLRRRSSLEVLNKFSTLEMNLNSFHQTEAHRQNLRQTFEPSKLYLVNKEYVPNEKLCQLSMQVNDLVGMLKPYDPSGSKQIWMVYNGESKGFMPCNVLVPYEDNMPKNLISLDGIEPDVLSRLNAKRESLKCLNPISEEYCIAVFDFKAVMPNMLSLNDGDIYQVIEKQDKQGNTDWWLVESNNNIGYVPSTYVTLLD